MGKIKDRAGEINKNFQGLKMKIIEYRKAIDLTVQFEDGTIVKKAAYKEFSNGAIKNLNYPSIFGVGYIGEGEYKAWGVDKLTKQYTTWFGMLSRCYNENNRHKAPTYKDVSVWKEWYSFQVFAKWFDENYVDGCHLDKDLLSKGNRLYSPETCCFLPQEINALFTRSTIRDLPTGVYYLRGSYQASTPKSDRTTYLGFFKTIEEAFQAYKTAREKYIKEVADEWKDLIAPEIYQAMYSWIVEITD